MENVSGNEHRVYDVIIIGGGPAGYTSALYAVRAGLDTLLIEKMYAGGQMTETPEIDNFPGFDKGIDGFTLAEKMKAQAERFGAVSVNEEVLGVDFKASEKRIDTKGKSYYARAVIIASGASPRELGVERETELVGKGVAYCASCDGMFYRGKTVAVIGGGNTAAEDAILLSRVAKKVILVHRRDSLRADKVYHEPLMRAENVEIVWNSAVSELVSSDKLLGIVIKDVNTGKTREISCDGLFVSIGRRPATEIFAGKLELDPSGYIVAGESTKTSEPGVFAVGDVRTKPVRQIVTAAADGAVAVHFAGEYLANGNK